MRPTVLCCLLLALPSIAVDIPPIVRGAVTVHLEAGDGPLTVNLSKRDLNIYAGPDLLQADLYDPDRVLVGSLEIPDDGQAEAGGPAGTVLQTATLTDPAPRPGLYQLQIRPTASSDLVWGLTSTAARYMVAGTPLFNDAQFPTTLSFQPPADAFKLTLSALHPQGEQVVTLTDDTGAALHSFDLAETGQAQVYDVPEAGRSGWWHLRIDKPDIKFDLGKVTAWTLEATLGFDLAPYRHALLPYQTTRYLELGEQVVLPFTLRNATAVARIATLAVKAPEGLTCRLLDPPEQTLAPGQRATVRVEVSLARALTGPVRGMLLSRTPEATVSAAFFIRPGRAPVDQPVKLPIRLEPYRHENALYGYAPDYEPNEVYFDHQNRPVMRHRTDDRYLSLGVQVLEGGEWQLRSFVEALKAAYPTFRGTYMGSAFATPKVAFDGHDGLYTLVQAMIDGGRRAALLFSPNRGLTWQVYDLGVGDFNLEQFTGHNDTADPPAILLHTQTRPHPATFCAYHDLNLFLPKRVGERLEIGEPVLISRDDVGACQHSGGPAATATKDGRTHIVWIEVAPDDAPGAPTYIATYDHARRTLSEKVLLGYAPPVNDVHNVPAIVLDSHGTLHVVLGAHGEPFGYRASLRPNDISGGFTPLEPVLTTGWKRAGSDADGDGGQTYVALVCGPDDTLHIAFRQWRQGVDDVFGPEQYYAALSMQSKRPGEPWSPAQPMVVPPRPGYSIYYHKLSLDRRGGLWLSYSYLSADTTYQSEFPDTFSHRAMLTSRDGRVWKLATTADFAATSK